MYEKELATPLQAGFSASSRNFKKAVDRNRIKRLMREAYRLQKNPLQEALQAKQKQLALFFIYTGKELPDYKTVSEKIGVILNKLRAVL
jgi:ribonuclease P protein component